MSTLPAPREPGRYRVLVVCLGNICRSPMGPPVLQRLLAEAGLAEQVEVVSAGTEGWHTGRPMDRRAAAVLTGHGYDARGHRAQQVQPSSFAEFDLVLAMDTSNRSDLIARAAPADRVLMFRSHDPLASATDLDVPDPYYGEDEGFEAVLRMIQRSAAGLVRELELLLAP